MNAPRIACLAVALLLTPSVDLLAQREPPVAPGDRVRVSRLGTVPPLVCTVLALKPDTLVLDAEDRVAVPLALVKKVEVSRGKKSNVGKGALIGGSVFAGLALLVGIPLTTVEDCEGLGCVEPTLGEVLAASAILGGLGAGVGALIGALSPSDRWEEVPLDRLRVGIAPHRYRGLAISVSVAL